jgi:hypothetical protein
VEPNEVLVIPSVIRLAVVTSLIGTGGPFHAPTVMVFINNVNLTYNTVLSDLTVATFTGYANVVGMTWDSPYIDTDGTSLVFGQAITIVATDGVSPNLCYGYALVDSGVTSLKGAARFVSPQNVAAAGQAVAFLPALRYSGT